MTNPGWYPDPTQPQTVRYWDGSEWTEQRAPLAPEKTPDQDASFGVLLALALPPIGAVYGIWLLLTMRTAGLWTLFAACVGTVLWLAALLVFGVIAGVGG